LGNISANFLFDDYFIQSFFAGKWQPVLSKVETFNLKGKYEKSNFKFSNNDIMQFNADGSVTDGGQLYFSYSLEPNNNTLLLFEQGGHEKKFEIVELTKTTMKIIMQVSEIHRGLTSRGVWTLEFKRK
jgi:hypothetical protein